MYSIFWFAASVAAGFNGKGFLSIKEHYEAQRILKIDESGLLFLCDFRKNQKA